MMNAIGSVFEVKICCFTRFQIRMLSFYRTVVFRLFKQRLHIVTV